MVKYQSLFSLVDRTLALAYLDDMEYPHKPSMGLFSSGEDYSILYRRKLKPVEEPQVGDGPSLLYAGTKLSSFWFKSDLP